MKSFSADNTKELAKMNINYILNEKILETRQVGNWCMKKNYMEKIYEVPPVIFELTNPKNCVTSQHCLPVEIETQDYFLGLNPGFVHLSSWRFYKQWIEKNGKYHYTYGERGGLLIKEIVKKLKLSPTTRQCIVNLWDVNKNDLNNSFVPCTTQWAFYIKNKKLVMITTMRSQDACRGFFLDTFAYPVIQQIIAKLLNRELGSYYHVIYNSHIYSDDILFAQKIIDSIKNMGELNIDKLSFENFAVLSRICHHLYNKYDTKTAQRLSKLLPRFWEKWVANQIIYIYTKYIEKEPIPTELTSKGLIMNVLPEVKNGKRKKI